MSIMMYMLRHMKQSSTNSRHVINDIISRQCSSKDKVVSPRIEQFRKKLRETTPIQELEQKADEDSTKEDPLKPWPNSTNPHTGEIGGPRGPEPTRYGDWERKGRVSDF